MGTSALTRSSCLTNFVIGYFRGQDVSNKPEIVVPVYERSVPAADEPTAPASTAPISPSIATASAPAKVRKVDPAIKLFSLPSQPHARLSLLLISFVACLLCASFVAFPHALSIKFAPLTMY